MSFVYPRATVKQTEPTEIDDQVMVDRILAARETETEGDSPTMEQAVGVVVTQGGSLRQFYRLWKTVEAERAACRTVNPAEYSTVTTYKVELFKVAPHLDESIWYDGLKAEAGVSTFADLQFELAPAEV